MLDKGKNLQLDEQDFDVGLAVTPERSLWIAVIVMALEDLDAGVRYLNDKIVPRQNKVIVQALTQELKGSRYWDNRAERKRIIREKSIVKRELYKSLMEINDEWFTVVCHFAGVSEYLVRRLANQILTQEIKTRFSRGDEELRSKLKPRRRGRYKVAER